MQYTEKEIRDTIAQEQRARIAEGFSGYFKYCSASDAVLDGVFIKSQLRFTQPRAMNDPLEFNPTLLFQDKANYHTYTLKGKSLPSVESFYRLEIIEGLINDYGIFSVSRNPFSMEMWSQYADGHKGLVLEFKLGFERSSCMLSKQGSPNIFGAVEYLDDHSINLGTLASDGKLERDVIVKEMLFKKTSRWAHEKEFRLVRRLTDCPSYVPPNVKRPFWDTNVYLFDFDWDCVNSVVLGVSMSRGDKTAIIDYCKRRNVPVYQAFIYRDIPDVDGRPCMMNFAPLSVFGEDAILEVVPQLLCTDSIRLGNALPTQIKHLRDLPYYKGYEEAVKKMLK